MSAVSEWIVREYFESLGFLARQPRKYMVTSRPKQSEEEVDLIVFNPRVTEHNLPKEMLWGRQELRQISRAVVGVRGWHTERFSPAVLEESSDMFRLAEKGIKEKVTQMLGPGPVAIILCLPEFPASGVLREKALEILREKGIDGVILFRTMLLELAAHVDINKNYEKSDMLQMLRILKNYDLLKDAQMELFRKRRKGKKEE
jgi:hypothetical protein